MKQKLLVFIAAMMGVVIPFEAFADNFSSGGINYETTSSNTCKVIENAANGAFSNYTGEIVIPPSVEYGNKTYTVTKIENDAFNGANGLTSVSIPATVTEIGHWAFYYCTSLKTITLNGSVATIGAEAFYDCKSVSRINVSSINDWLGTNMPSSINEYCTTDLYLKNNNDGYDKVENLVIPNGVTSLRNNAFKKFTFKSVDLNEVTSIGGYCFEGASSLEEITLRTAITAFDEKSFYSTNITKLNYYIPSTESITKLPLDFSKISTLTLGSEVTTFIADAFKDFTNLTKVEYLGTTDNWIGLDFPNETANPLSSSSSLTDLYCKYSNGNLGLVDIVAPASTVTTLKKYTFINSSVKNLYLNNVATIGEKCFSGCSQLYKLHIYKNDYTIGSDAFAGTNITSLEYAIANAETLETVPYDPSNITEAEIAYNVKKIAANAFAGSKITEITIPNVSGGITICSGAFQNASQLQTFTVNGEIASMDYTAFSGTNITTLNYNIPAATKAIPYDNCYTFRQNLKTISVCSGVTSLPEAAFASYTNVTTVNLPSGLTSIGTAAFYYCTQLTKITMPSSVETIGERVFNFCSSLGEIYALMENPPTISTDVFSGLKSGYIIKVPYDYYSNYTKANNWKNLNPKPFGRELALDDDHPYKDNLEVIESTLCYTRNVTTDNWMGVYLPFEVDVTKVAGTYATLTGVNGGVLDWTTKESGTIPACTPFIYKPTAFNTGEVNRDITFTSSDGKLHSCTESHAVTPAAGYKLDGIFTTKTDMASTHAYALSAGNFYCTNDANKTLKPYRIFLTVPSPTSNAPIRNRINGEDVTGIEDIVVNGQLPNGQSFNLSGQKVGQDYKGIVIVNGKKVIRK